MEETQATSEATEEPKKMTRAEEKKLIREKQLAAMKKNLTRGRRQKTVVNDLWVTFIHREGKLRRLQCVKVEESVGWYGVTYWDKRDILTLWLPKIDWQLKPKEMKQSGPAVRKMLEENPLPSMGVPATEAPAVAVAPPPPAPAPKDDTPTIYEGLREKHDASGFATLGPHAEMEFHKQEAARKLAKIKHAQEIAVGRQTMERGPNGVSAGFEP